MLKENSSESSVKLGYSDFLSQFTFKPENAFKVGVEREFFTADKKGNIVPMAPKIANWLGDYGQFDPDLPACHLESRLGPVWISDLRKELWDQENILKDAERDFRFKRLFDPVGPEDIPLFISPKERYLRIAEDFPEEKLRAGCRVISIQSHVGMPDAETALVVYNYVRQFLPELCELGDESNGERLKLYKFMAPDWQPPHLNSWEDFYQEATEKGFAFDLGSCWYLIRITRFGTIEFRMFDSTPSIDKIVRMTKICHELCLKGYKKMDRLISA